MDFTIPESISQFLNEIDQFIEASIHPLEQQDDNIRFFDHRREDARTDWERDGLPNEEWEALLAKAKALAIEVNIFSYPFPKEHGGRDGSNLGMAIIREHLAAKGLGLHNDLQNEHSIVGNNVGLLLMLEWDAVFAFVACPAIDNPAGIRCVCAGPAVGGFAWTPVGNVEADEGVAFFKDTEQCIIKFQEVADAGARFRRLRHILVLDRPAS